MDSSPLPSPFLRSWWLAGTSQSDRHFLLVVDDAQLIGGLALEERHHMSSIRMMGYGSASDHLDLLAAPGHEAAVLESPPRLVPSSRRAPFGPQGRPVRITLGRSPAWPCPPRDDGRRTLRDLAQQRRGLQVDALLRSSVGIFVAPPTASSRRGDTADRPRSQRRRQPRHPARSSTMRSGATAPISSRPSIASSPDAPGVRRLTKWSCTSS